MDIVVCIPKSFGLDRWIDEGQLPGEVWDGREYDYYLGNVRPNIQPSERVYCVYNSLLRGYAPLVRVSKQYSGQGLRYSLVRHGDAVAVTIPQIIKPFRGFRYRFWNREDEIPFPDWRNPDATPPTS